MDTATFAFSVFEALQEFDRTVTPFGLYSVRDIPSQPKPKEVVLPFQERVSVRDDLQSVREFCDSLANVGRWGASNNPHFYSTVPNFGAVALQMVRVSKIKVRQYGSRYHLDKHLNFEHRWERLELDKEVLQLRHPNAYDGWRMLLFLGFDKAQRPFEREFGELKPHQERESHGLEYFERSWDDSAGRGFKVKVALWVYGFSADRS